MAGYCGRRSPIGQPPRPAAVLACAAQLVAHRGLARRRYAGPGEALSAHGAIQRAFTDLGGNYSLHGPQVELKALEHLRGELDGRTVWDWNDDPATSAEQVAEVLAAAAERAERETPDPFGW